MSIDAYRLRPGMWGYADTCAAIGEHQGDPHLIQDDDEPGVWAWNCCGETEPVTP